MSKKYVRAMLTKLFLYSFIMTMFLSAVYWLYFTAHIFQKYVPPIWQRFIVTMFTGNGEYYVLLM